jgi:hypothetical protein
MNHKDAEDDDKKLSKPKKTGARKTEASSRLPAILGASAKLPLSATRDASTKVTIQIPTPSAERY